MKKLILTAIVLIISSSLYSQSWCSKKNGENPFPREKFREYHLKEDVKKFLVSNLTNEELQMKHWDKSSYLFCKYISKQKDTVTWNYVMPPEEFYDNGAFLGYVDGLINFKGVYTSVHKSKVKAYKDLDFYKITYKMREGSEYDEVSIFCYDYYFNGWGSSKDGIDYIVFVKGNNHYLHRYYSILD